MNWLTAPFVIAALIGWSLGGLFWLSWLTDRHSAAGGVTWLPALWQTILAGPGSWIISIAGRIVR